MDYETKLRIFKKINKDSKSVNEFEESLKEILKDILVHVKIQSSHAGSLKCNRNYSDIFIKQIENIEEGLDTYIEETSEKIASDMCLFINLAAGRNPAENDLKTDVTELFNRWEILDLRKNEKKNN
jgi:hypothetical protein